MDKPRKFIDIVIPFNNEYLNLKILLPKILIVLKKIKYFRFRLIFIDDGSNDEGFLVVKKYHLHSLWLCFRDKQTQQLFHQNHHRRNPQLHFL